MSHVKALVVALTAQLPADPAAAIAQVDEFLATIVSECQAQVAEKNVRQSADLATASFRVRAAQDRWKSLSHRLGQLDEPTRAQLGAAIAPDRFQVEVSKVVPSELAKAAFAPPKSPRQRQEEAAAAERAEKAKRQAQKGKGKPKGKPAGKPRAQAKPAVVPVVAVKPARPLAAA